MALALGVDELGPGIALRIGAPEVINTPRMAILLASLVADVAGFVRLKPRGAPLADDLDLDTMDFAAEGPELR